MFIMLSRGNTLTIGNYSYGIPHQAHLYFKPAFIVASFLCLFVKHPFREQFSWFATSVQRNLPSFGPRPSVPDS